MKTETFNSQAPIAIAAIGAHMVERNLPAPMSIDIYSEQQSIRVMLVGGPDAQRAWLDSVEILDEKVSDIEHPAVGIRSAWTVRLPDLGIRFELVGYRAAPFLSVVTA